ncbi:MAG TPA: hypothetical protein PLB46_12045, partial [Chitinophagales bacterium]|nr:hypothetical protein [Chitinophagales bacterium]
NDITLILHMLMCFGLETGVASGVENSTTTGIVLHFLIAINIGIIFFELYFAILYYASDEVL